YPDSRLAKDLNALLTFSTSIGSIGTIDDLQRRLLRSIADNIPLEHAAFLQVSSDETEIESIRGWDHRSGIGARVQPSSTVVTHVLTTRTAVLVKGVIGDGTFGRAESLVLSRAQSVLCVPIQALGKLLALVYAETRDPEDRFDEHHLQLMAAVCSVAAMSLHN